MSKERITILFPIQTGGAGNHSVAVGYTKAFRLLGYNTDVVKGHTIFKDWSEFYRFFTVTSGQSEYQVESVVKSASLNMVTRIMETDPDVLIIIDGAGLHRDAVDWIRKLGIRTIVIGTESPYQDKFVTHKNQMSFAKVFTNELATSEKTGIEYLPVGYDSEAHHPMLVSTKYRKDVVFAGSGFPERISFLEGVDWEGIDFEFYGHYQIPRTHPLARNYKDAFIPNAQAAMLYAGSKISLNLNRVSVDYEGEEKVPEARSLAPRAYEIPACGGFMISEYREEIKRIYGDLVPTFTEPDQLNELIHRWLPKDKKREEIGRELAKLSKPHSYIERAKKVVPHLS